MRRGLCCGRRPVGQTVDNIGERVSLAGYMHVYIDVPVLINTGSTTVSSKHVIYHDLQARMLLRHGGPQKTGNELRLERCVVHATFPRGREFWGATKKKETRCVRLLNTAVCIRMYKNVTFTNLDTAVCIRVYTSRLHFATYPLRFAR